LGLEVDVWEPDWEELKRHPAYIPVEMGYENRPNVVGVYRGSGGGRSLLFNGHVDVIPADPKAWSVDPWAGVVKGGKLYGRGASDMKSGLAAFTMALKTVLDLGFKLKGDVILEYVVDEEFSGHGTLSAVLRGYRADAGISCEASDMQIQPATTGSMWFEIEVEGKTASMSRRWEAVPAIDKAYKIYKAVSELEEIRIQDIRHPLYPDNRGSLSLFVGMFNAGTYPSSIADRAVLKGRMGVLPGEDPVEAQRQLKDYISRVSELDPWLRSHKPRVEFKGYYAEPTEIPADHPIVKTLEKCYMMALRRKPVVMGHDGAADTRFLIKYGGTPTPIFGPGTITQMHATDEWVRIKDLVDSVKVLALAILEWCGFEV